MSTSDSGQYDLLDRLAEEFAARFRRGERPALEGATVKLLASDGTMLGEATTSSMGIAAFATPGNLLDKDLRLEVTHADFNRRNIGLDGAPLYADVREFLYS